MRMPGCINKRYGPRGRARQSVRVATHEHGAHGVTRPASATGNGMVAVSRCALPSLSRHFLLAFRRRVGQCAGPWDYDVEPTDHFRAGGEAGPARGLRPRGHAGLPGPDSARGRPDSRLHQLRCGGCAGAGGRRGPGAGCRADSRATAAAGRAGRRQGRHRGQGSAAQLRLEDSRQVRFALRRDGG